MRTPGAATTFHVAHFEGTMDAAAFVAALSRFLDSPAGSALARPGDDVEVWVDSASTPAGVEVYLSADALRATSEGFAQPPLRGTRAGSKLAPDCALVIGVDLARLTSVEDAHAHIERHHAKRKLKG